MKYLIKLTALAVIFSSCASYRVVAPPVDSPDCDKAYIEHLFETIQENPNSFNLPDREQAIELLFCIKKWEALID